MFLNKKNSHDMDDFVVSLGNTLKEIREIKGVPLQEVAHKTDINYALLNKIETGEILPTKPQVHILARFYNFNANELIKYLLDAKTTYEIQTENREFENFYLADQKIKYGYAFFNDYDFLEKFDLQSRRYIGSKAKLTSWIMDTIQKETKGKGTFIDLFAGTGVVANKAMKIYKNVILNDILYSNNIVYKAFFENTAWNKQKVITIVNKYNRLDINNIPENYFSMNFGGKFFEKNISKLIGYIRQDIENKKTNLTPKEYAVLITSLIYTIDRLANTVGHFDAYIKRPIPKKMFNFQLIQTADFKGVKIFREDANELATKLKGDIAYIDPPYNSRQYSRFYHIYENLVQWKKPNLYGVALKPEPENMSKYCTVKAKEAFKDLVENLDVKYLVVSYNNTYKSKSNSSVNKIQLEEIMNILQNVGETKVFEQSHKYFNTGKTNFENHKELLFITKKYE